MGSCKHKLTICRNYVQGKLVDNANGTLRLLESLLAFDDVQTFTVIDDREEHENLLLTGRPQNLSDLLGSRLAIQIRQHGPRIEHHGLTSGFSHAAALPFSCVPGP